MQPKTFFNNQDTDSTIKDSYINLMKSEVWRFVIDGEHHHYNDPLYFDNDRKNVKGEVGYLASMETAVLFMLETLDDDLTLEGIVEFHNRATSSVLTEEKKSFQKGIRNTKRGFGFSNENLSYMGLVEYVVFDTELFQLKSPASNCFTIRELYLNIIDSPCKYKRGDVAQAEKTTQDFLKDKLAQLTSELNTNIAKKSNRITTLFDIVHFVRKADMLHPFHDGNIRTFIFIILNKLLLMHGFPPSILNTPNHFDGYSTYELCLEVIEGMEKALMLIHLSPDDEFLALKSAIESEVKKRAAIGDEIADIYRLQLTVTTSIPNAAPSLGKNTQTLFASDPNQNILDNAESIPSNLKTKQFK